MKDKIIKEVTYDWSYSHEHGESYYKWKVGENLSSGMAIKIEEAIGNFGGKYAIDIHFKNGKVIRTFNVNSVVYGDE